jgi:hypothetical protein
MVVFGVGFEYLEDCPFELFEDHALAGDEFVLGQEHIEIAESQGKYLRLLMRLGSLAASTEFIINLSMV